MARALLGAVAYEAYCALTDASAPAWDALPMTERLAWGAAVQAALTAAHCLTQHLPVPLPVIARNATRPAPSKRARHAGDPDTYAVYRLAVEEGRPRQEVCAALHISIPTYYRLLALGTGARQHSSAQSSKRDGFSA